MMSFRLLNDAKIHPGEAAVALLEALPRVTGNPYVIVGKKEKTYLTDLQHPWRRAREAAGLGDVREQGRHRALAQRRVSEPAWQKMRRRGWRDTRRTGLPKPPLLVWEN